jgi:apolipoprotein N-acyltransferase
LTGLLTALLLVLTFPRFNLSFLAPFALVPLLFAASRETRAWRRFWIGYVTGVLYWFGTCYWIQSTLAEHGGMGVAESWALFILFCLAKAIQMGIFAWLAGLLTELPWSPLAIAALWTFFEWTHNYTGFAWLVLGNAAINWPVVPRLAPWTGVWGLSFVFALMAATVCSLPKRKSAACFAVILLLILLPRLPSPSPQASALAVQPNIPDDVAWSNDLAAALDRRLAELSIPATPVAIVVWPEVPAPLYDYDPNLPVIARRAGAEFLAGVVSHTDRGAPLNSALLISREGRFVSRYDKVHLVPFGEYVPWPFGAIAQKVSTEAGDFASGSRATAAHGIGTFICYESVFPNYIRQFPRAGATVLFNLSNDSWFGQTAARYQHMEIVRMRAAENARWIVRVTNNGISASIDPAGRIIKEEPSWRELAEVLPFGYASGETLYVRWGDWFVWLCAAFSVLSLVFPVRATFARLRQKA